MERREITQTIEEIDALRRGTREALRSFWFPLVLFGAITLASSPIHLLGDGTAVGVFWAFAGPAGGILTGIHYARREAELGVSRPSAPYLVVALGIMLGSFLLPLLTSGDLQSVVSNFSVAGGYLAFAWIERDARIAAIAVFIAAVPLLMLAIAPDSAGAVSAAVIGGILLTSGLWFRRSQAAVPGLLG